MWSLLACLLSCSSANLLASSVSVTSLLSNISSNGDSNSSSKLQRKRGKAKFSKQSSSIKSMPFLISSHEYLFFLSSCSSTPRDRSFHSKIFFGPLVRRPKPDIMTLKEKKKSEASLNPHVSLLHGNEFWWTWFLSPDNASRPAPVLLLSHGLFRGVFAIQVLVFEIGSMLDSLVQK